MLPAFAEGVIALRLINDETKASVNKAPILLAFLAVEITVEEVIVLKK